MERQYSNYISKIGRRFFKENPDIAKQWIEEIKSHETSIPDKEWLGFMFLLFCNHKAINPFEVIDDDSIRTSNNVVTVRRLFIAVVYKLYNQLSFLGYAGRNQNMFRQSVSEILNCNEVWISRVTPSIIHEIKHLKGYESDVDEIITYITNNIQKLN